MDLHNAIVSYVRDTLSTPKDSHISDESSRWTGGVFFGRIVDTYGTRCITIPCTIGCTVSIVTLSFCSAYYQIFLVQGVGFGISAAGLFSCATTSVGQWFNKRKALALGIVLAGSSLGMISKSFWVLGAD